MEPGPLEIVPGVGYWLWAKPIGQRHDGIMVTVPVSGRGSPGFKTYPRQIFFQLPSCVHRGWRALWWQIFYPVIHFYLVVVNKCTEVLAH